MTDPAMIRAVIEAAGDGRATARVDQGRASIVLDVSGLDDAARRNLDRSVRDAAQASGAAEVRVVETSQRTRRTTTAVASGKGGVGKSTVAANLAVGLLHRGRRVGMVDADIYGPSQPRLLDAEGVKPVARDKVLQPVATRHGLPMLSMGQLVPADQAIAWRGPMAASALGQLMEANWGAVDTLVVDMPPGTGDIQLSMIQKHRPDGVLIVSTPQDLALIDARRAIDLFAKAGVPIMGLVENMAGYVCPSCGEISDPFGSGGAEAAAAELNIPFLGRVPLTMAIRQASDDGNVGEAQAFDRISDGVFAWLNQRTR